VTRHVFLSPHLDDAILSCGGLLAQLHHRSVPVLVISIFAGLIDDDEPLSPFAAAMHQSWGAPSQTYAVRRAEDSAALARVGFIPHWLNFPDAIYRGNLRRGEWFYTDNQTLFGAVHPAEQNLPQMLAQSLRSYLQQYAIADEPTVFYVPLAVGNHVDHQLTCRATKYLVHPGDELFFYEDYPYTQWNPADRNRALQMCAAQGNGSDWVSQLVPLMDAELQTKLAAIAEYKSQLAILFGSAPAMRTQVTAFAHATGGDVPAEKLWKRIETQ